MIVLVNTEQLQGVTDANATTTEPNFTFSFADEDDTTFAHEGYGKQDGVMTGTTDLDLVTTPASGTVRKVLQGTIHNRDTVAHTIEVFRDDGTNQQRLIIASIVAGGQLRLDAEGNWHLINATGGDVTAGSTSSPTTFLSLTDTPGTFTAGEGLVANDGATALENSKLVIPSLCEARLTLTNGTPVTTADVATATTIHLEPMFGQLVAVYNGTRWVYVDVGSSGLSIALGTLTSDSNYDVLLDSSGTLSLSAAWASDTARTTAITQQDGVWVIGNDRYMGSFRTISTTETTDTASQRFLFNASPAVRVLRSLEAFETTSTWTYTTNTWRQANGSTSNQVEVLLGLNEEAVGAEVSTATSNSSAQIASYLGIGLDSTSAPSSNSSQAVIHSNDTGGYINAQGAARFSGFVGLGKHDLVWLERSQATGTTTWYGFSSGFWQYGLQGSVRA